MHHIENKLTPSQQTKKTVIHRRILSFLLVFLIVSVTTGFCWYSKLQCLPGWHTSTKGLTHISRKNWESWYWDAQTSVPLASISFGYEGWYQRSNWVSLLKDRCPAAKHPWLSYPWRIFYILWFILYCLGTHPSSPWKPLPPLCLGSLPLVLEVRLSPLTCEVYT